MFKKARTKLTVYYLAIIMAISIFFSLIIYQSTTFELRRIENMQRIRKPNPAFLIDPDIVKETKSRIFFTLLTINSFILGLSGISGYFLAGKTLAPISKMIEDQKDFVSNASHELRTPLSVLKTQIEVALRDKEMSLDEAKKLLESNLEDVNNMTKLSNYLLELNKFQNSENIIKFKKVDLANLVIDALKTLKLNDDKTIKTELNKSVINCDPDSTKELISILIDNAHKYGESKEISLSLRNKELKISDKGTGISREDLPHIFDRFYRGDKARSHDGYGLGLSIAKQIADNHGAKIKVESKINKGSTFKVIFS